MMNRRKQSGFSLVELMVGLIISLIVLGGAVYVFQGNTESNIYQMRSTRFVQQMRDVMERMVTDIRRAGYQGFRYYALTGTVAIANPFDYDSYSAGGVSYGPSSLSGMTSPTRLTIDKKTGEADDSCITYAYNLDDDYPARVGISSTSSAPYDSNNTELFGFQLDSSSGVGVVRMRTGGGSTLGCNSGTWQGVTDSDLVDIYQLSFTEGITECRNMTESSRSDCYSTDAGVADPIAGDLLVIVRQVAIAMQGRSVDDNELTFKLEQVVDLPNNRTIEVR